MKLVKEQKVSASMLGSNESLSTIGTFQIIENALTELTGKLKIDGITVKEQYNAFWVFAKTRVKFFKKILWNESLTVTCFISSKSLARIHFDIEAKNSLGEFIFYARIEACALDIASQRIRKLSTVGVSEDMLPEQETMDINFSKFDYETLPLVEQVKIRSTNIDMSHHTNNLEYLRFIMNTYSVKELETRAVCEMEVVYMNQSFENDVLDVLKGCYENKDIIVLQKEDKPIVKCEIIF